MIKKLWEKYREIIVYIFVGVLTTLVAYGVRLAILYPGAAIFNLDLDYNAPGAVTIPEMAAKVALLRGVAQSVGWVAGVVFAFIPNKKWVFRNEESSKKKVFAQFWGFVASRFGTYFVELGLAILLPMLLLACGFKTFRFIVDVDADLVSMAVSMVVVTVLNYLLSKLLVFRKAKKGSDGEVK